MCTGPETLGGENPSIYGGGVGGRPGWQLQIWWEVEKIHH